MEKIIAATYDIADQKCKMYNALEWHNFIADTREECPNAPAGLEELFDYAYGDEFWFEVSPDPKVVYQIAFDLRSEEFIVCHSDADCEAVMAMAEEAGDEEEIFWAE
tara:strand:- start:952 stop:1272 length:321 start_codon:yes stop_codon:yes gene_type:complete